MIGRVRLLACLGAALVGAPLATGTSARADETVKLKTAITLPNSQKIQSFDIGFVDPRIGIYVLADRTNAAIDVITTDNNKLVNQLKAGFAGPQGGNNDIAGPDGVIIVDHREVWAGDGDSTVKIINLNTGTFTTVSTCSGPGAPAGCTAATAKRADELCEDTRHEVVLIANDAATPHPFVTFISTETQAVLGHIVMDGMGGRPDATGGIEQCQWSHRTDKFYLNLPASAAHPAGEVVVINAATRQIETSFTSLGTCAQPQGMALGPDRQILLGCNGSANSVIIDERDGHVIANLAGEGGSDEVYFNPGNNHYFLANSAATPQNLGVVDADKGSPTNDASFVTNDAGKGNVHSVAADPVTNQVYVPIPSTATKGVCSAAGGIDAQGCIAVFASPGECVAEGAPVTRVSDDGNPEFRREHCRDRDDRGDDR